MSVDVAIILEQQRSNPGPNLTRTLRSDSAPTSAEVDPVHGRDTGIRHKGCKHNLPLEGDGGDERLRNRARNTLRRAALWIDATNSPRNYSNSACSSDVGEQHMRRMGNFDQTLLEVDQHWSTLAQLAFSGCGQNLAQVGPASAGLGRVRPTLTAESVKVGPMSAKVRMMLAQHRAKRGRSCAAGVLM